MDSESVEETGFALCVVAQELVPWIRENIELAWERQEKIRLHPSDVSPAETNISTTVELEDFIRVSTTGKGAFYWIKKPIAASESSEVPEVMVSFIEPVDFKVIGLPIVPLTCFPQSTSETGLIPPINLKPTNRIEIEKDKAIRLTGVSKLLIIRDQDEQTEVHLDIDDASRLQSLSTILDSNNAASSSLFLSGFGDQNSCLWDSIHLRSVPDSKMVAQIIVDRLPLRDGDSDFFDHASTVLGTHINLQEAMTKVRTKALTSHEQVMDSGEMENDDWILLTATISGPHNVNQAVKDIQAQFPTNDSWKTVEHHGENMRSSMSLSITEGGTRAAIMLIVLPESQSGRDSEQEESSCHLHNAANDDDVLLMEWLLNNSSEERWIERLQQKNEDGFSVLQQACRVGSMSSVHYLMSLRDPLSLLREFSDSGETALHLSVRNGYPQILHELLKAVERADRKELLSFSNNQNQTVDNLAEVINKADSLLTKAVIKYHRWISNEDFKSFFEGHDYSLFRIPLEEKMTRSMYTKTDSHNPDELGQVRFKNFDTMICLRFCDLHPESEKSKEAFKSGCRFNRESLQIDPNSLHAWSNRGSILICDGHRTDRELEDIAHRVLQLQVERGKQHFLSIIDYAYGFAETNRSDANRKKGCKMFDDAFKQVQGLEDIVYLSSYCDYFHAKILIRRAQDTFSEQKLEGENLRKVIEDAIDCLIRVAIHNVDEFMGDLWIWLAELQRKSICERIERDQGKEHVQSLLSKFQREVGQDEDIGVDVASCLQQAQMIAEELHHEPKFLLRIGKLYLQQARESTRKQEIEKFFKEARDISVPYIFNEKPIFMGVTNYVPAVLGLWAMQYTCQRKGERRRGVITDYEKMTGKTYKQGDERQLWRHASTEFYGPAEDEDGMLDLTIQPLINIVYKQDGAYIAGEWLARVKALLGHSCEDIEAVFYYSQQHSDTGNKTKNYEKLGRYYESIENTKLARDNYHSAITNEEENAGYYKPRVSKYRLRVLGNA